MDRATWGIVFGTLVLVVAGLATAALVRGREGPPDLTTPSGVVLAWEEAVLNLDADRAWDLLATSAKSNVTKEQFQQRLGTVGRQPEGSRITVENERLDGDTATVDLMRTYPRGGLLPGPEPRSIQTARLIREGGQWRISVPPEPFLILRPGL